MTRPLLQWNDERPDLYRTRGRSGHVYRIGRDGPGNWWLRWRAAPSPEREVSRGELGDMKRLANEMEADAARAVVALAITWTRIRDGEWWGMTPTGPAYKITRRGRVCGEIVWSLAEYPNADAERGSDIDEGSLAAMKHRAQRAAGEFFAEEAAPPPREAVAEGVGGSRAVRSEHREREDRS